ncbi:MAG: type II toxin-antitoxin system VapC family toxin [Myxococcota bacterium]
MTVVADTNVIAYLLLRTEPFVDEVRTFWASHDDIHAPASWQAELVNVLWLAVRAGVVDRSAGLERLRLADALGIRSAPVSDLWEGALTRATRADHAAYDTLFVELATRLGAPLATFDKALLASFPHIACRPHDLLEAGA